MRFFTDEYFSETQKSKLLENVHLVEHSSVKLEDLKLQSHHPGPMFCMEWQQDHVEPATGRLDDGMNEPAPVTDLSSVMVMMLVGCFGIMFVFDVFLH